MKIDLRLFQMSASAYKTNSRPSIMLMFLIARLIFTVLYPDYLTLKNLSSGTIQKNMHKNYSPFSISNREKNTSLSPLCKDGFNKFIQVCSMPSSPEDFGNLRANSRVLVSKINSYDIKMFMDSHHISLPNASITFNAKDSLGVPLYTEEISKKLHLFYMGTFAGSDFTLPFTAHYNGKQFLGKVFYIDILLQLASISDLSSDFYRKDQCLSFNASCSKYESTVAHKNRFVDHQNFLKLDFEIPESKHSEFSLQRIQNWNHSVHRQLRSAHRILPQPKGCALHLVADHLFYKYVGNGNVMEAVNVMFNIVNDVDALYRSTDFDGDGQGDNIGFIIGKVTVLKNENDPNYRFTRPYMTSNEYLKELSYMDFSDYCLGVGFTFREFSGIAGTAYPSYSDNDLPGGMCQKRVKINSHHISFNSAVVTFSDHGKTMKQTGVMLTMAHELGHSFGAQHDETQNCLPDGEYGNFIMSPSTNPGNKPNNRKFSVCSIQSMLPIIMKKGSCFIYEDQAPHCGNGIPEVGEECDCGISENCKSIDPCCTPADVKSGTDRPCSIRRSKGKKCSPVIFPCCTATCLYRSAKEKHVCNSLNDCSLLSQCNGQSGHCPISGPKPTGTLCNNGLKVCKAGKCVENVCEYHNLSTCFCRDEKDKCKMCCKHPSSEGCKPASEYGIFNLKGETIYQDLGAVCYGEGYCSSLHKCLTPNVVRPSNAIFGIKTTKELQVYMKNYWFYYILTGITALFIVILLAVSYKSDDMDYMKALRYGKMLAIFAMAEHQTKIYRKTIEDINGHYEDAKDKIRKHCEPLGYIEALVRLKILFPDVSTEHLSRITKISASEHVAVKLLILQGFKLRTLTACLETKN